MLIALLPPLRLNRSDGFAATATLQMGFACSLGDRQGYLI